MDYTSHEDMTAMVEGYLRAALWSTCVETEDGNGASSPFGSEHSPPLEQLFCFEDIAHAMSECRDFCEYVDDLENDPIGGHPSTEWTEAKSALAGMDPAQAGHDFWLTREGHGAGFWDRGLGVAGDRLSDAAKTFGAGDLAMTYQSPNYYRIGFGHGDAPDYVDDESDDRETCGYRQVETCSAEPGHKGPHRFPVHG